jgi:hypothetical protein
MPKSSPESGGVGARFHGCFGLKCVDEHGLQSVRVKLQNLLGRFFGKKNLVLVWQNMLPSLRQFFFNTKKKALFH